MKQVAVFLINAVELPVDDPVYQAICACFTLADGPESAELLLVLGGDGAMLRAIRRYGRHRIPFAGLNYGHVGFLMNKAALDTLREFSQRNFVVISVVLLQAQLFDAAGRLMGNEYAFNDFYFERATSQAAQIRVTVNGKTRFNPLVGDGVILCSSAGSTAYNAAAGGVILPIGTNGMVLTGICPAVFHHWRSSLLASEAVVVFESMQTDKRPARFIADGVAKPNVVRAEMRYSHRKVQVAFAGSQDYREKVMNLQFYSAWS
jgi:NAD+ kinase